MQINEEERLARMAAIAAASADDRIAAFLNGLSKTIYPDIYPDMVNVPAASTVRVPYAFPGLFYLSKLEVFPIEGTYPARVDIIIERFSHLALSFTAAKATAGPLRFHLNGATDVVYTNTDAAQDCNVYIEWAMINFG